ncbi:Hydrolase [Gammaproteobacteria bacterium]
MTEQEQRAAVIREAKTWLGTPYHLNAKVKGAGVDCGTFLISSFHGAGLIPDVNLGTFFSDFHLHKTDEVYLRWILEFCRPVDVAEPGDIILYRYGRILAHGALVVDYPRIIHAPKEGVVYGDGDDDILRKRAAGIFSFWGGRPL